MHFELQHGANSITIKNFKYSAEDAKIGNPYNTSFNIHVISGSFSGLAECEYDIKEFVEFVKQINEMYLFKREKVEMHEICYGGNVTFTLDKTGHIRIEGKVYGSCMEHTLEFEFMADQTSLKPFLDSLNQVDLFTKQL